MMGLWIVLVLLILLSGFFSCAETAMMSINRYRLRHKARKNLENAKKVQTMLFRTDRLLSVILLGNTFSNIFASAIATILADKLWGQSSIFAVSIGLAVFILLFCEIIPKTYAALYPERVAYPIAWPLEFCLKILYPFAFGLNIIAVNLFKLLGVHGVSKKAGSHDLLSKDELKSLVFDQASHSNMRHHKMLLGVLDLEQANLLDIMVPRSQIFGIDLNQSDEEILKKIKQSPYSKVPVYENNLDHLLGVLHLKQIVGFLDFSNEFELSVSAKKESFKNLIKNLLSKTKVYFVPEITTLQQQLIAFQKNGEQFGLVVDEYGEIQGMITLEDIVEEIVGNFQVSLEAVSKKILRQVDGSYIISGNISLRELNRAIGLTLPTKESKTFSGLITQYLQQIPTVKTCVKLSNQCHVEILEVSGQAVARAKLKII